MKLLAIDTAANLCAACVFDTASDTEPVAGTVDVGRGHVEHLMSLIADTLDRSGLHYQDLERIAVSVGPGSFTGVRVGVAAARGLSLALNVPAVGITTLEAIAAETRKAMPNRPVLAAIDARRDEIYFAAYDHTGCCAREPQVSTAALVAVLAEETGSILAGSAAHLIAPLMRPDANPDFGVQGATAGIETYARLAAEATATDVAPKPLYLRAPDAKPQTGFAVDRTGS